MDKQNGEDKKEIIKIGKIKRHSARYLKRLVKKGSVVHPAEMYTHSEELSSSQIKNISGSQSKATSLSASKPSTALLPYTMQNNSDQDITNSLKITTKNSVDSFQLGLFSNNLRTWAIENRISQNSFSKLLTILKTDLNLKDLSSDARTLLKINKTKNSKSIKMGDGNYYHFGLRSSVVETLQKFPPRSDCKILNLQVNVDGLPISKSSNSQFWPILGHIEKCHKNYVFPIGVYHGKSKPSSLENFLKGFVEDFLETKENGLLFKNERKILHLAKILCDAPAKSFLLGVKSQNAYFGCTKCTTEGDFVQNRMTYPDIKSTLRTDESFKNMLDEDYHKEKTPLLQIEVGLVTQVPLDYMHLVCLGVTKKLLLMWTKGDRSVRLFQEDIFNINKEITTYRECSIMEFARKPRTLDDVDHWKATEFTNFFYIMDH